MSDAEKVETTVEWFQRVGLLPKSPQNTSPERFICAYCGRHGHRARECDRAPHAPARSCSEARKLDKYERIIGLDKAISAYFEAAHEDPEPEATALGDELIDDWPRFVGNRILDEVHGDFMRGLLWSRVGYPGASLRAMAESRTDRERERWMRVRRASNVLLLALMRFEGET